MNLELDTAELNATTEQAHYEFVVDADLALVGGGSAVVNY